MRVAGVETRLTMNVQDYMSNLNKAHNKLLQFSTDVQRNAVSMRASFNSINSVVKTTGQNLSGAYRSAAASIKAVKNESKMLRSNISSAGSAMSSQAKTIQKETRAMASSVKAMNATMDRSLKNVTDNMKANAKVMNSISNSMKAVGKVETGSMKNTIAGAKQELSGLQRQQESVNSSAQKGVGIFDNMKNMVSGIIFAQSFYKGLNALQGAVGNIKDLAFATETANTAFGIMLKSGDQARALTTYLEDFAAKTTFSFDTASNSAKKLLAYGFELSQMDFMLNTIGDATAAIGDPEAFGRITRALGQIQTRGKLVQQEMLQLTEAGIPAFEILGEKLGLTSEQLGEIGKQGISADIALRALTEGINERYGGAMAALAGTTQGMISNLSESFAIVGKAAGEDIFKGFKNSLRNLVVVFDALVERMRNNGIGAALSSIFGPETYLALANFGMGLMELGRTFLVVVQMAMPFLMILGQGLGTFLQASMPFIQFFASMLTELGYLMLQNSEITHVFISALAGLVVAVGVATAIGSITAAIGPLIGAFSAGTTATAGLAGAIATLKTLLSGGAGLATSMMALGAGAATMAGMMSMFNKSKKSGLSTKGMVDKDALSGMNAIKDSTKEFNSAQDDFKDKADTTSNKLNKVGKNAKKAAKEMKGAVAAFDEIYTLPGPDQTTTPDVPTGGGGGAGLGGIGAPEIGMPSLDGLGNFLDQFKNTLTDGIESAWDTAFKPQTALNKLSESMKRILRVATEKLAGFGGIFKSIGDTLFISFQHFFRLAEDLFKTGGKNWGKIFEESWAKIKVSWIKTGSDLAADTANAITKIKFTSQSGLKSVEGTWQLAMGTLPNITDKNLGATAALFAKNMKTLDSNAISILRGTSDSMAVLFNKIGSNMTEEQAMKQFTKNLRTMKNAGLLDADTLQKDFEKAMRLIGKHSTDYSTAAKTSVENIFGDMRRNATKSSSTMADAIINNMKNMSGDTVTFVKDMGGNFSRIFDGINKDSDFNSNDTRMKVIRNIEQMKKDGVLNVEDLRREVENKFKSMANESSAQLQYFAGTVNDETRKAANFADSNARVIAHNINTHVSAIPNLTKDQMVDMKNKMVDELVKTGQISSSKGNQIKRELLTPIEQTPGGTKEAMRRVKDELNDPNGLLARTAGTVGKSIGKGLVDGIISGIGNFAAGMAKKVLSQLNDMIRTVNRASPKNPLTGGPLWFIPLVKYNGVILEKGGMVVNPTMAMMGEKSKKEAVLPLENYSTMDAIGKSIGYHVARNMNEGMGMMAQSFQSQQQAPLRPMYVGTLIADDRSMRELSRKLHIIEQEEKVRRFE